MRNGEIYMSFMIRFLISLMRDLKYHFKIGRGAFTPRPISLVPIFIKISNSYFALLNA